MKCIIAKQGKIHEVKHFSLAWSTSPPNAKSANTLIKQSAKWARFGTHHCMRKPSDMQMKCLTFCKQQSSRVTILILVFLKNKNIWCETEDWVHTHFWMQKLKALKIIIQFVCSMRWLKIKHCNRKKNTSFIRSTKTSRFSYWNLLW